MTFSATLLVMLAALSAPAPGQEAATAVFSIWSAEAVAGPGERYFDPVLNTAKASLVDLPYREFHALFTGIRTIEPGSETEITLKEGVTLTIRVISREADGQTKVQIVVIAPSMKPDQPPTKALDTIMALAPGKKVRLCGVKLGEGDLVIVLALGGK